MGCCVINFHRYEFKIDFNRSLKKVQAEGDRKGE